MLSELERRMTTIGIAFGVIIGSGEMSMGQFVTNPMLITAYASWLTMYRRGPKDSVLAGVSIYASALAGQNIAQVVQNYVF